MLPVWFFSICVPGEGAAEHRERHRAPGAHRAGGERRLREPRQEFFLFFFLGGDFFGLSASSSHLRCDARLLCFSRVPAEANSAPAASQLLPPREASP